MLDHWAPIDWLLFGTERSKAYWLLFGIRAVLLIAVVGGLVWFSFWLDGKHHEWRWH